MARSFRAIPQASPAFASQVLLGNLDQVAAPILYSGALTDAAARTNLML